MAKDRSRAKVAVHVLFVVAAALVILTSPTHLRVSFAVGMGMSVLTYFLAVAMLEWAASKSMRQLIMVMLATFLVRLVMLSVVLLVVLFGPAFLYLDAKSALLSFAISQLVALGFEVALVWRFRLGTESAAG